MNSSIVIRCITINLHFSFGISCAAYCTYLLHYLIPKISITMKLLLTFSTLTVLLAATASAFTAAPARRQTVKSISSTSLYSTVEASPFIQGPRIIRDELPIVYVYDHCPFCVRVRLALGVKNVKHNVVFLQNDDIPTPTKLIGKKIAPIFVSVYNLYVIFLNKTHIILYHFYSFQQFMSTSSPLPIYSLNSPYQKTTLPWENPLILSQK